MAIIKFITHYNATGKSGSRTKSLRNGLEYIKNPKKTMDGRYVSSINCYPENALDEMEHTQIHYGRAENDKSRRTGYHFTISWSPDEDISYDKAMEVTRQFIEEYLPGYEVVYSVHTDQKHVHSHIIFNSVNSETGKMYQYNKYDFFKIVQPILDNVCKNNGLKTLEETTGMSIEEYEKDYRIKEWCKKNKKGKYSKSNNYKKKRNNNKYYKEESDPYTQTEFVKDQIDRTILEVNTMEEFFEKLRESGFVIRIGHSDKHGEYFTIKGRGINGRRSYKLGKEYSIENIRRRIEAKNKPLPNFPKVKNTVYMINRTYWIKKEYRVSYKDYTPLQKQYMYGLYERGLIKRGEYPNYYEIKKGLKEIQKLQDELNFIYDNDITDMASLKRVKTELFEKQKILKEKKSQIYDEQLPYKDLLEKWKKKKTLENKYENIDFRNWPDEDKFQYKSCTQFMNNYDISEKELEEYQSAMKTKIRNLYQELKKVDQQLNYVKEIEREKTTKTTYDYDIPDSIYEKKVKKKIL